jgi:hypothetical protein
MLKGGEKQVRGTTKYSEAASEILCSLISSDRPLAQCSPTSHNPSTTTLTSSSPNVRVEAPNGYPKLFHMRSNWISAAAEQKPCWELLLDQKNVYQTHSIVRTQ